MKEKFLLVLHYIYDGNKFIECKLSSSNFNQDTLKPVSSPPTGSTSDEAVIQKHTENPHYKGDGGKEENLSETSNYSYQIGMIVVVSIIGIALLAGVITIVYYLRAILLRIQSIGTLTPVADYPVSDPEGVVITGIINRVIIYFFLQM